MGDARPHHDPVPDDKHFRVRETAEILNISRGLLYGLMDQGLIAYLKIGGARRVPGWVINEFLRASLVQK
jgi:excisionase family DNA binding protein